ncbi:NADH dehydrogenase (quinone) [Parafrankia sp. EAN1pec]|uniref:proton-conducting transporter transmembrane domain-containing protein n=1 Tax=Parafrankia sp. (strain EAN1pec) TaxID=298653 RepID=UPI0000544E64|nr:NADH dehydrogenase (quinone) [Frankia sp. EAN1pec]
MTAGPSHPLLAAALITSVAAPGTAVAALAVPMWFGRLRSERIIGMIVAAAFTVSTLACAVLALGLMATGRDTVDASIGPWFGAHGHTFAWSLTADMLSVPFALVAAVLIGLTGAVSARYLHREPGFARFHLLLVLFGTGVELTLVAGELPALFFGWELVGLTSALLIAFFVERPGPVRHGLRAFLTYRAGDAGLLVATVWLGHLAGTAGGDSGGHGGRHGLSWDDVLSSPGATAHAEILGFLLLTAVLGKSALVPVGGWLPRAMEGPTPSSAVFYGAVSIHLGPYLLLRAQPMLDHAPAVRAALVCVGALTALHATLVSRAQSDVKSALAYGSMTQVGLIVAEIGLGLHTLAVLHILAHATLRCAQILRSPSALRDSQRLEQALGGQAPVPVSRLGRITPGRWQPRLYRHAFEKGYADVVLRRVGGAAARALTAVDRWQRQAADLIGGRGTDPGLPSPARPTDDASARAAGDLPAGARPRQPADTRAEPPAAAGAGTAPAEPERRPSADPRARHGSGPYGADSYALDFYGPDPCGSDPCGTDNAVPGEAALTTRPIVGETADPAAGAEVAEVAEASGLQEAPAAAETAGSAEIAEIAETAGDPACPGAGEHGGPAEESAPVTRPAASSRLPNLRKLPDQALPPAVSRPGAPSRHAEPSAPPWLPGPRPAADDLAPGAAPSDAAPSDVALSGTARSAAPSDGAPDEHDRPGAADDRGSVSDRSPVAGPGPVDGLEPADAPEAADDPGTVGDPAVDVVGTADAPEAVDGPGTADAAETVDGPEATRGPEAPETPGPGGLARRDDDPATHRLRARNGSPTVGASRWRHQEDRPRFPADVRPVRPRGGGPW